MAASMKEARHFAAKVLYGALFAVALPVLLILWARAAADVVSLPVFKNLPAGMVLAAIGAWMMIAGWVALWRDGGGLPMNAFPPPRFVSRGPYRIVSHPIYVGFVGLCLGMSIVTGSASGLWLVTPA